ncbi:MAG TPA: response regulator, partial [Gemmatimonadales bacterium]
KGTGLGLATAYGIARQAGGDVRLESELGKGTRAIIRLPRRQGAPVRRADRISGPTSRKGGGETILLVEDEMSVRRVVSRILGGAGYKLIAAEDGDSALRRLDAGQHIDLLVTDVVTPGLGGRALAEKILERDPRTRILFISGYAADERFQDLLERPGIAYLPKPFTIVQLQGAVRHLLDLPPRG